MNSECFAVRVGAKSIFLTGHLLVLLLLTSDAFAVQRIGVVPLPKDFIHLHGRLVSNGETVALHNRASHDHPSRRVDVVFASARGILHHFKVTAPQNGFVSEPDVATNGESYLVVWFETREEFWDGRYALFSSDGVLIRDGVFARPRTSADYPKGPPRAAPGANPEHYEILWATPTAIERSGVSESGEISKSSQHLMFQPPADGRLDGIEHDYFIAWPHRLDGERLLVVLGHEITCRILCASPKTVGAVDASVLRGTNGTLATPVELADAAHESRLTNFVDDGRTHWLSADQAMRKVYLIDASSDLVALRQLRGVDRIDAWSDRRGGFDVLTHLVTPLQTGLRISRFGDDGILRTRFTIRLEDEYVLASSLVDGSTYAIWYAGDGHTEIGFFSLSPPRRRPVAR